MIEMDSGPKMERGSSIERTTFFSIWILASHGIFAEGVGLCAIRHMSTGFWDNELNVICTTEMSFLTNSF